MLEGRIEQDLQALQRSADPTIAQVGGQRQGPRKARGAVLSPEKERTRLSKTYRVRAV